MTSADVRAQLVYALSDDLIGPDPDDPRDTAHQTESLDWAPSHWYLTGFLAPTGQKTEDEEDPEGGDELQSSVDDISDAEAEAAVARRPMFPSSIGVSVLVPQECKTLSVRVTYGTYAPEATRKSDTPLPPRVGSSRPPPDAPPHLRFTWTRTTHEHQVDLRLTGNQRFNHPLEGSNGLALRVVFRPVPERERGRLVPKGTRYATIFLVNERPAIEKPEQDKGFVFQTRFSLTCDCGFVPRPNLRGAEKNDDFDEQIGNLQHDDCFEFGVGHGVSVEAKVTRVGDEVKCHQVSTAWMPSAEIEKVVPAEVKDVQLHMDVLGDLADGAALQQAVGLLITKYGTWIEAQAKPGRISAILRRIRRGPC